MSVRRKKDREYLQEVAKDLPADEIQAALSKLKDLDPRIHADLTQEMDRLEKNKKETS